MAFADWVFEQTANCTQSLTATDPLFGSSSLRLGNDTTANNRGQAGYVVDSAVPLGISRGKIRSLIQQYSGTATVAHAGGLFCLAESTSFGSNSDDAYCVSLNASSGEVSLGYHNIFGVTNLFDAADISFTVGTTVAIELEWNQDVAGDIGGQHFIVRAGTMTDFSDLTEVINYVDPTSRTIAGYEGILHIYDSFTTPAVWYFDQTSIYTIS